MNIIYGLGALLVLFILLKIISLPIRIIGWIIMNGIGGLLVLFIFNLVGGIFGLSLELSLLNCLVAGVFGLPGVLLLLLTK